LAELTQLWADDLTEADSERLIDKVATEICRRKMQAPAIMTLEMGKPLASVMGKGSVVFAPFAIPFVGFDAFNDYSRLLAQPGSVERLLQRIEALSKPASDGDK